MLMFHSFSVLCCFSVIFELELELGTLLMCYAVGGIPNMLFAVI